MIMNSILPPLNCSSWCSFLHAFLPSGRLFLKLPGDSQVCSLWGGGTFSLSRHSTRRAGKVLRSSSSAEANVLAPSTSHAGQRLLLRCFSEKETVQQVSVSSKTCKEPGLRLCDGVCSFPNQLSLRGSQRRCD